jgi:anti-sigma factor RsiW
VTSTDDEMACRELVELLTDYLEDALPAAERVRLETHLADCDGCTAYMEQIRAAIRLTGMLAEEQIPDDARAALLEVFRAWRAAV